MNISEFNYETIGFNALMEREGGLLGDPEMVLGSVDLGEEGTKEIEGYDLENLRISSWICSRNYKPKVSGFKLDGKTGKIECKELEITSGIISYNKTSFTDSVNSGYYIGSKGVYFGAAADATKFKFIIATGVIEQIGTTIDGTSTIDGRAASILATAIDDSGHFADDAINTASETILADFTFGVSGAIQIGEYVNGVSGDVKISPTGILARNTTGATTFSLNGTTGVAVLNGLVVGTNVGLGTAQDSAGVTTIVGNTVTTSYVNALNITAQYVAASISISSPTITGGTIRTNSATYPKAVMNSSGFTVHGTEMIIRNTSGTLRGYFGGDSDGVHMIAHTGTNIYLGAHYGNIRLAGWYGNSVYWDGAELYPDADDHYNCGCSSKRWDKVYTGSVYFTSGEYIWFSGTEFVITNDWRPSATNAYNLGNSSRKWKHLYLDQNLYMDSGQNIYWSGTSYYLKHDGNVFKINDDLQPISQAANKRLGYTGVAWYAVHSQNYLGCNLPTSNLGIEVFKKIKTSKLKDGKAKGYHAGKRHYFETDEFPDEMKMTDKDSGKKDIELTRTLGVTVGAVRELVETIDELTSRLETLEKKFS